MVGSSSSFSGSVSSVAKNMAPVINVSGRWATQIWDDISSMNASETTDANGDALTFNWNFGDGKTATGAVVTHTFYNVGLFTPTLTVEDGHGGVSVMTWEVQTVDSYTSKSSSSTTNSVSSHFTTNSSSRAPSSQSAEAPRSSSSYSASASTTNSAINLSSHAASSEASSTGAVITSTPQSSNAAQSSAPAVAKDSGGGSVDLLILVLLSSLGFAWRGKKAA
jgi:hypothetical protein